MINRPENKIVASLKKYGVPLKGFQKFPKVAGWQNKIWDEFSDSELKGCTGFGVNCGRAGLVVIDLDVSEDYNGIETWDALVEEHGDIDTLIVRTANDGRHVYFKLTDEQKATNPSMKNSVKTIGAGIDVRAEGGQVVAPTSTVWKDKEDHSKGKGTYDILNAVKVSALPQWLFEKLTAKPEPIVMPDFSGAMNANDDDREAKIIREAQLDIMGAAQGTRNDTLARVAFTVGLKGVNTSMAAHQLKQAATMIGLSEAEVNATVDRCMAEGFQKHEPIVAPMSYDGSNVAQKQSSQNEPLFPDHFYEDAYIGRYYYEAKQHELMAVKEWRTWAEFDETSGKWIETHRGYVRSNFMDWFKYEIHTKVLENNNQQELRPAKSYLNTKNANSAIKYIEGSIAISSSIFDKSKDVVLTPTGDVIELRTGDSREAKPEDRFTKSTATPYVRGFISDKWEKVLEAFPEDVVEYLQVVIGQALTGYQPADSAVYFFYGDGSNGKSVFFDIINEIFGDYADTPDSSILLRSQANNAFTKHVFKGLRAAILEELPEAQWLDAAMLKKLVGTRYMRGAQKFKDEETFENTSTIFVNTNHKPLVSDNDHGTWRRLKVIDMPFKFVKPEEATGAPHEKLRDAALNQAHEQEDICMAALAWAVEGAVKWFANGMRELPEPQSMIRAQNAWRRGQDKIENFMEDNFIYDSSSFVLASDIYDIYKLYLADNGFQKHNQRTFIENFKRHHLFSANRLEHVQNKRAPKDMSQSMWTPAPRNSFDEPKPRIIKGANNFITGIRLRTVHDDEQVVADEEFAHITADVAIDVDIDDDDFNF